MHLQERYSKFSTEALARSHQERTIAAFKVLQDNSGFSSC